jgi:hypothetical protein
MIHSVFPHPMLKQLPPRNHPMLSPRQIRDERIGTPARLPQPVYIAG